MGPDRGASSAPGWIQVLPVAVVYDSELSTSLPVDLSVASGLNALAHCVDSLWAPRTDPINQTLGLDGARALAEGLPLVVDDPTGAAGRDQALYGCYLAAVAFASAGSGMHHKICHVLGGAYDLPHAQTHAIVLPHVLAHNAPRGPPAGRASRRPGPACRRRSGGCHCRRRRAHRVVPPASRRLAPSETTAWPRATSTMPSTGACPPSRSRTRLRSRPSPRPSLLHAAWAGLPATVRSDR